MIMVRIVSTLLLMLLMVGSSLGEQEKLSIDEVRSLITNTFLELSAEPLSKEKKTELLGFVKEFKHAREEIDQQKRVWGYVMDQPFQAAYKSAINFLAESLRRGHCIQQPEDKDVNRMLEGYEKNAGKFEIFLKELEERNANYPSLLLSGKQIIQKQLQFSAFVMANDIQFWRNTAWFWSVFIPISNSRAFEDIPTPLVSSGEYEYALSTCPILDPFLLLIDTTCPFDHHRQKPFVR